MIKDFINLPLWFSLKNGKNELASATNQLKMVASDGKKRMTDCMRENVVNSSKLNKLLKKALTSKINDREVFMKGIDHSYYYDENEWFWNIIIK